MKGVERIPDCKVTLIGDSGVGKTSIIGRYISGIFRGDAYTTSGANYSQKIYKNNNQKVRLNIWDTAGQEKFRSLGRNFYKDAYIICIIYDITNKKSFQNIKEVWYPEIEKHGEKYKILAIVGNKCDLYEDEEVEEKEVNDFSNQIGAKYFLISAKNGEAIEEMFKTLANLYLNPDFKDKVNENNDGRSSSIKLEKNELKKDKKNGGCC